jgi:maltooligosyltrehalose trehalohydrolase
LASLEKACEKGFFHDGTWSSFRGSDHGFPIDTRTMPTWRLVVCAQNHDQVGNRARGDRNAETLDVDQLCSSALMVMAGPFTPMLFMGEEWAASTPFQFFTSHPEPELGEATAKGRIAEFAKMGWDPAQVPDPQDPATFERSKLDWAELSTGRHPVVLDAYRQLASLRRTVPALTDPTFGRVSCTAEEDTKVFTMRRGPVLVAVNFGPASQQVALEASYDEVLFHTPAGVTLSGPSLTLPPHGACLLR